MSDAEGRRIFSEFGCLDESLSLIEDFLIHGRVFVCKDASSKMMVECHSRNILLDDMHIFPRPASTDELVAGSIVLASLCAAFDHIGFICETSYNFLQIRRLNRSLVLTMLHVFAYLGGEKFFNFSNSNLVTVVKSMVTFLEGDRLSDSTGSCIPSVSNSGNELCPCVRCPFSEDAVSVDTATSLLLESLQNNAFLGPVSQDELECNSNSNLTVCNLSDLLSLVELVAFRMVLANTFLSFLFILFCQFHTMLSKDLEIDHLSLLYMIALLHLFESIVDIRDCFYNLLCCANGLALDHLELRYFLSLIVLCARNG